MGNAEMLACLLKERKTEMERPEQLAGAYRAMAQADHYMVGIVEKVTADERDDAEQFLISWQNNQPEHSQEWRHLELALDCLENDRRAFR